MVDAAKKGAWDMAFLGIDPAREGKIGFTGPTSRSRPPTWCRRARGRDVVDVDREGVRVVAAARANYELFLTRELKRARAVPRSGVTSAALRDPGQAGRGGRTGRAQIGVAGAWVERAARMRVARRPLHGGACRPIGVPRGSRRGARVPPRRRRGREGVRPGRPRDRAGRAPGASPWPPPRSQGGMIPDFLYGTAWKEDGTEELTGWPYAGFRGIDTANQRQHYFEAGVGRRSPPHTPGWSRARSCSSRRSSPSATGRITGCPTIPARGSRPRSRQSFASSLEHLGTDDVD